MESHGSESTRRSSRRKRKPLADLTNTQPHSSASSSSFANSLLKPKPNPVPKPKLHISRPNPPLPSDLEQTSSGCSSEDVGDGPIPAATPKAKEIPSDSVWDEANYDKTNHFTVYTRQIATGSKCKRKAAPSASSSCPPVGRIRSTKGRLVMDDENVDQQEAFSVPCHRGQKECLVPES